MIMQSCNSPFCFSRFFQFIDKLTRIPYTAIVLIFFICDRSDYLSGINVDEEHTFLFRTAVFEYGSYSLRHTYCTDLQRAGVPINVAKHLMGHSDISVTGNTYTDETPDVVFGALEKLENFLKSENKKAATPEMEAAAEKIS
ncbi:MAG: tyrosine-type recombinase/integrase [Clostridiales bacterium]|nr:tyrosine-type recombinase/integrase [Candidatus Cacconaster stercorequi]